MITCNDAARAERIHTFLFVGERPSARALELGISWESGGLAARQLFDALEHSGWNPREQRYTNLYRSPVRGDLKDAADERRALARIRRARRAGILVVGMGKIVQRVLTEAGVEHLRLHHPAARGSLRLRSRYRRHLREVLGPHRSENLILQSGHIGDGGVRRSGEREVAAGR